MAINIAFYIIVTGAIYLLVSLSFYKIYQSTKYFYLTQSTIVSLGAYLSYYFFIELKLSLIISIVISIIISTFIGILTEFCIYKPMRKNGLPPFAFLIVSIGLYTVMQNCISLYFGDDTKTINTSEVTIVHEFFGAYITTTQIVTIIVSLTLFLTMYLLYNYTKLGKQIRAVSENSELSNVYGICSDKIILICFGIGSGLGAIAGILYAYDTNLTPTMGFNLLMYGIVAMIIGGVGSFRGLLFGSLLLATAQNLVAYYLDTKWMDATTYVILIAFLLWKPLGFSGKRLKKIEL